jgi:hypothetical protein
MTSRTAPLARQGISLLLGIFRIIGQIVER